MGSGGRLIDRMAAHPEGDQCCPAGAVLDYLREWAGYGYLEGLGIVGPTTARNNSSDLLSGGR